MTFRLCVLNRIASPNPTQMSKSGKHNVKSPLPPTNIGNIDLSVFPCMCRVCFAQLRKKCRSHSAKTIDFQSINIHYFHYKNTYQNYFVHSIVGPHLSRITFVTACDICDHICHRCDKCVAKMKHICHTF